MSYTSCGSFTNGVSDCGGGGGGAPGTGATVDIVANAAARLALVVVEGAEAIQTDNDTRWLYDGTTWHQYQGPVAKARLSVTGYIAQGTTFSTIASGVNYTHSGDSITLNISQTLFRATNSTQILVNGVKQDKETEILWLSSNTFQLISLSVDNGDIITLYN